MDAVLPIETPAGDWDDEINHHHDHDGCYDCYFDILPEQRPGEITTGFSERHRLQIQDQPHFIRQVKNKI